MFTLYIGPDLKAKYCVYEPGYANSYIMNNFTHNIYASTWKFRCVNDEAEVILINQTTRINTYKW